MPRTPPASRLVPALVLLALPLALHGQAPETAPPPPPGPATEVVPAPQIPPPAPPSLPDSAAPGLDLGGYGSGLGGFPGGGRFPFYQVTCCRRSGSPGRAPTWAW